MTDEKIINTYKHWSIEQTCRILKMGRTGEKKIRDVLKKHKVKIRKSGWAWR